MKIPKSEKLKNNLYSCMRATRSAHWKVDNNSLTVAFRWATSYSAASSIFSKFKIVFWIFKIQNCQNSNCGIEGVVEEGGHGTRAPRPKKCSKFVDKKIFKNQCFETISFLWLENSKFGEKNVNIKNSVITKCGGGPRPRRCPDGDPHFGVWKMPFSTFLSEDYIYFIF